MDALQHGKSMKKIFFCYKFSLENLSLLLWRHKYKLSIPLLLHNLLIITRNYANNFFNTRNYSKDCVAFFLTGNRKRSAILWYSKKAVEANRKIPKFLKQKLPVKIF